ncbi:hypothetical protein Tco_0622209 [Tanacetum coccineum]
MVNTRANDNTIVGPNSVEYQLASMMSVINCLTESVTALENNINHGEGTSQRRENLGGQNGQAGNHYGRLIKVEFLKIDGEDVYQDSFEALLNKVELSESYVVILFISGLKEEIAYVVRMSKPATLIDVFFLSKLQDANMTVSKSINATLLTTPMTNVINNNDNRSGGNVMRTYSPGHKCSDQMYSLEVCASEEVFDEDEDCVLTKQGVIGVVENVGELMQQVSFNAMTGIPSYKTMRIKGPYKNPPNQKDAIDLMVKELLEARVIRDNQSSFSSPIVMVKKKDGS